jgi:tetratricopeptide (TPR) repeat protein
MKLLIILASISLLAASPVSGQQIYEILDLEADVRTQIDELELRLFHGLDQPANKQVVMLQWLIELYDFIDEKDKVEACYQKILDFFSSDVGTLNAYALYLIERRGDYQKAEKQLLEAANFGEYLDVRALDLGTTYELLARVEYNQSNFESSVSHARKALELLSEESSAGALRALAESHLQSGAFDEAADAYIKLIAIDGGSNREDINALQLFLHKTTRYNQGSVANLIEDAIEARNEIYRTRIESEGGKVVSLPMEDGVILEGTLRLTDGAGAVLFVPDLGARRSVYTPYAQLLFIEQISTLSVDHRGHGGSRSDSLPSYADLSLAHVGRLSSDIVTGFRFLQNQTGFEDGQIAIVVEGQASALVEKAMHDATLAAPVIHLSPTFRHYDRELINAISFHPDGPILLVFSSEDLQAMLSVDLFRSAKEFSRLDLKLLDEAGHGVDMLRRDEKALEFFQQWVGKTLGVR